MDRRNVFRILAATAAMPAAGQHTHSASGGAPAGYQPRLFSREEYALVEKLCAMLIPAGEDGPGALEAGVPWYLDTIVLHGSRETQEAWRHGLAEVEESARTLLKSFVELAPAESERVLDEIARNEANPRTSLDRFFVRFKSAVIDGFCQSEAGMKFLGYKGNGSALTFAGCTHPNHQ